MPHCNSPSRRNYIRAENDNLSALDGSECLLDPDNALRMTQSKCRRVVWEGGKGTVTQQIFFTGREVQLKGILLFSQPYPSKFIDSQWHHFISMLLLCPLLAETHILWWSSQTCLYGLQWLARLGCSEDAGFGGSHCCISLVGDTEASTVGNPDCVLLILLHYQHQEKRFFVCI